jgi:hypothetical protein
LLTDIYISKNAPYLGTWEDDVPGNGDRLLEVYNAWRSASAMLEEWYERDAEINRDPHLNDDVKWTAKQKTLADYEERLSRLLAVVTRKADELARDEITLKRSLEGSRNDALAEVRAAEIRSWYSRLGMEQQGGVLREALDSDDREVLSALLSAPRAFRLIPELLRRHIVLTLVNERAPELEHQRRAIRTAKFALDQARFFIHARTRSTQFLCSDRGRRLARPLRIQHAVPNRNQAAQRERFRSPTENIGKAPVEHSEEVT